MPNGYYFLIGCWLWMIVVWSCWLDPYLARSKDGFSVHKNRTTLIILLLLVICIQGVHVAFPHVNVNMFFLMLACCVVVSCYVLFQTNYRLQCVTGTLLLTCTYWLLQQLFVFDPIIIWIPERFLLPLYLLAIVLVSGWSLHLRLTILSGGFVFGELLFKWSISDHIRPVFLGDALFRDQWLIAITSYALVHAFLVLNKQLFLAMIKKQRFFKEHAQERA